MGKDENHSSSRHKILFYTIYSVNAYIFETLISVRMISLLLSFHEMIYKSRLKEPVYQTTVTKSPKWFLTTKSSTHIF